MGTLRELSNSAARYWQSKDPNSYASMDPETNMDIDPNATVAGKVLHFKYEISGTPNGTSFIILAKCSGSVGSCADDEEAYRIIETGKITGSGTFA